MFFPDRITKKNVHFSYAQMYRNDAKTLSQSRLPRLNKLLDIICLNRKTYFYKRLPKDIRRG